MTPHPRERRGGVAEVGRLSGAGHGGGGTATGPMGYPAKPEAMGALISTVFADRLLERGVKYALKEDIAFVRACAAGPDPNSRHDRAP
ncbi:hypothetical protein AB0C21_06545 [Spirillospora sp. NPDC049024]